MATAKNTDAQQFPNTVAQALIDASRSITHFTGWDAAAGGNWLTTIDVGDRALTILGQTVSIPAEMLVLTQPEVGYDGSGAESGRIGPAMAERMVRGAIAGGTWWQAHYGAPGTNHTDNVLTELGRAAVAESEFTVER